MSQMKTALGGILLMVHCSLGMSQTALLGGYDFDEGGFALLVRPHITSNNDPTYTPYYFADIEVLNRLKQQLVLKEKNLKEKKLRWNETHLPEMTLHICLNGVIVETIEYLGHLGILVVASSGLEYEYDGYFPLQGYELAEYREDRFANLVQARRAMDSLSKSPGLVCMMPPPWQELDGHFAFVCTGIKMDRQEFRKKLQDTISQHYPNEPFQFSLTLYDTDWMRGDHYQVMIQCRKTLADRFDLFPRKKDEEWTPFPLELVTYWER